jgi:hypothetical protein
LFAKPADESKQDFLQRYTKLEQESSGKIMNVEEVYYQIKRKNERQTTAVVKRTYFFFAAGFFSSFLAGFLATSLTSGISISM